MWLCLVIVAGTPQAIAEVSWKDASEAVSKKSQAYYEYAIKLDPMSMPGSALNGIGHGMHVCAIIGRMLGFHDEIREAETLEDPQMTPEADAMALMEYSVLLDSWVAAAKRALAMTTDQKISLWNLECLGKYGIPVTARAGDSTQVADFSLLDDTLVVYGDIDLGFYERFVQALNQNTQIKEVALGSAGGSVRDAVLSGMEIRQRGLTTTLHGPCYSACPLMFMGGERRIIWMGPGPHLGFHQIYNSAGAVPFDDTAYKRVAAYLDDVGADVGAVLDWMWSASPTELYEPTLDAICLARVATWVQRMCIND